MAGITKHYWTSARLCYRGVDEEADKDLTFRNLSDPVTYSLNAPPPLRPFSLKAVEKLLQNPKDDQILSVTICLPSPNDPLKAGEPIGFMSLRYEGHAELGKLHRHCALGIGLSPDAQGKGYGPEALDWLLEKAFQHYGMHKVSLGYWAYNPNAGRAYLKCGFVEEGRAREQWFSNGKWWDEIHMSILDYEWREKHQMA